MEASSLVIPLPATLIAVVVATIFITSSKYSPIARPIETLSSRCYLSLSLFIKKILASHDDSDADNTTVVTALYKYPVKSLRTIPCDEVVFDTKGVVGDRRYMLVSPAPLPLYGSFLPSDPTHRFVTQRQCPILARVVVVVKQTSDGKQELHFSTDVLPKDDTCRIPVEADVNAPIYKSTLWGDVVTVQDMGDTIAKYLHKIIAKDETSDEGETKKGIRLAIQYVKDNRTASDKFVPPMARSLFGSNPSVHLGDGFPILIASEASLEELNRRLREKGKDALPMSRFRPNIVIKGNIPFAEDRMKVIQIGATILYVVSSCPRCKESCTDQMTGIVTEEPVATMREFRCIAAPEDPDSVYFAVNAIPASHAVGQTIRVGDTVKVIRWGEPVYGDP